MKGGGHPWYPPFMALTIAQLLKEAESSMKSDPKRAVEALSSAFDLAKAAGVNDDTSVVAEELARGWARRKSPARSLHFATLATKLSPEQKSTWATLAKTCELIATRTDEKKKKRRAVALYKGAASAFKKAASLTKDPEDKRWLLELAGDASRQAK